MNALISPSLEHRHQVERILEIAASPAASAFTREYPAARYPGRPDLRLSKGVSILLAGLSGGPNTEVKSSFVCHRRQILSKRRAGDEQKNQAQHFVWKRCRPAG